MSAFIKSRSDHPATEEDSIFSKAIMKPSLQVSKVFPAASGSESDL